MGLLKDAIGSALGANQVSNGLHGPKLPFVNNGKARRLSPSLQPSTQRYSTTDYQNDTTHSGDHDFRERQTRYNTQRPLDDLLPTPYWAGDSYTPAATTHSSPDSQFSIQTPRTSRTSPDSVCRLVALPQINSGDGQPFLRGYSYQLERVGISEGMFIEVVDAINIAVIPNPEVQIFQKAASIAGWFVPGSASLGLIAGQVGVGVGAAFGHKSMINRVLSKANLEIFLPRGLEICIGKSKDLDIELGIFTHSRQQASHYACSPEQRLDSYNGLVAPLSVVLPPLENVGRKDPIAMLGRGIGARESQRKSRKAEKSAARGRNRRGDNTGDDLKWVMVREATPMALDHWRRKLAESDTMLKQDLEQADRRTPHR
ncbi:hypothetical protein K461DRAFT_310817 [Myriangium duriaei CBS 260.36]|uniref:Uncharacterized protein n=1 Tax=Myriangium duriaei CBS 260.36 TaxID=1168546 RepID=A0A9P4J6M1_9PEZI|nr:hypothetical protein K461DRAFT_310817 [Myriangium duriaei CBS 260.36]